MVIVAAMILLSTVLLAISFYRKIPALGSKLLFIQTILVFFWLSLDALVLFGNDTKLLLLFHSIKFVSIVTLPVLFLFTTMTYTSNHFFLKRSNRLFLWIIPVITLLMIASNELHNLVWSTTKVVSSGSYSHILTQNEMMFWIHTAYSYSLMLLALVLLLNKFLHSTPIYRKQIGFLLFGLTITWMFNALFVIFSTSNFPIDPTPICVLIILFIFYSGLFRYGTKRIVTIVRNLIVENLEDFVIVLDNSDLIIYLNPSFIQKLSYLSIQTNFIGSKITTLISSIPNVTNNSNNFTDKQSFIFGEGDQVQYYEVGETDVIDNHKNKIGKLIVLHEFTNMQKVMKKLEYMTCYDQLTGLYNRGLFEIELERLNTARQLPLSIIVGDLNGLKMTNDAFGHSIGDQLLKKLSAILKVAMRTEDIIARTGGDEFCIILPQTTEPETIAIIERINKLCEQEVDTPIKLSISWGHACKTSVAQDIQQVLKEADAGMYKKKLLESKSTHGEIVASLIQTLKESSFETNEHAERMRYMSSLLGRALQLSESQMDDLLLLALLHDLGKVGISDTVLDKPGKLTKEEWEIMKRHTEIGYHIASSSNDLSHIADDILSHHEHWDGKGYPRKLSGEQIPYLARIISVIDSYDVMTHERVYKKAISEDEAVAELKRCSGSQFDPNITSTFCNLLRTTNNYDCMET